MNGKLNKNIGFSLLPFSFIFLFDPSFSLLDPIPDFLGYVILCISIVNLADINSRIKDAFWGFRRAAMLNLGRFAALYFLNKYFVLEEQNVGLLLFTFVFAFFKLIIIIPSYKSLFDGLSHLATLYDGSAAFEQKIKKRWYAFLLSKKKREELPPRKSRLNQTERAYRLTLTFIILRALAQALPEFTTLKTHSMYEFINLLRVFGVCVVLPIGICWLFSMIKYCASMRRDRLFIENLSSLYLKFSKENQPLYLVKALSTGMFILIASFLLSIDLYTEHSNVIPDFIFYALMICGAILLKKYSKKWLALTITGALGIIASWLNNSATNSFNESYYFSAILKDINAYYAYYTKFAYQIFEAVIFIASVVIAVLILWDIYKSYTDFSSETGKFKKEFKARFVTSSVMAILATILSALGDAFYLFSQPFYYNAWYFSYSMVLSFVLDVVFLFAIISLIGFVNNSVKYKYRLYL